MTDAKSTPQSLDAPAPLYRSSHRAMACDWELFVAGRDADYTKQVSYAVWDEIDRLENELSRFLPESDVTWINTAPPEEPVHVGVAVLECLRLAAEIHDASGGAFDVTVGQWLDERRVEDGRIAAAGSSVENPLPGMSRLMVDAKHRTVTRRDAAIKLDLGAIGKGYALDEAARLLRDWGVEAAMLHSGQSTVLAVGAPPGDVAWKVPLRDPRDPERALGVLHLRDRALSGSGLLLHGQHIVDPRRGVAASGKLATWATAPSAALSDAVSTALMVMSPDEIEDFGERFGEHFGERFASVSGMLMIGASDAPQLLYWGEFEAMAENVMTDSSP